MSPLFSLLTERWQRLQPRERQLARWCVIIVVGAGLLSLEDWRSREQSRLQKSLPAAESRLAAMQAMADELNASQASRASAAKVPAAAESIAASLKAKGLALELRPSGANQWILSGSAAFDDWVDWVALVAAQGWRVERALVQRDVVPAGAASPRGVKIETTLAAISS